MKTMYYFLLFMILFNMGSVAIAYTGFFGANAMYSDIISTNPDELVDVETLMESLWGNESGVIPSVGVTIPGTEIELGVITFNWVTITIGIFAFAIGIAFFTKSSAGPVISGAIVGSIFLLMYVNSKQFFDRIENSMPSITAYIALMIGLVFFFLVIITIMDYLSGQQSARG